MNNFFEVLSWLLNDQVFWVAVTIIGIIIVLHILPNKAEAARDSKRKRKAIKCAKDIISSERIINYMAEDIYDIVSKGSSEKVDGSVYTDEEISKIRMYSYTLYKFAIQLDNSKCKYKDLRKKGNGLNGKPERASYGNEN